ncbi:cytochrome c biogenesis protein CcdA [Flavobacterium procerum]|uniref:Cytochrome c biogenesis protein CcdA n=1 Tax=Flavobacterium procerum TaxID=1455569 RepID=A0ABV6BS28_9FLAO
MKNYFLAILLLTCSFAEAQIYNPVNFKNEVHAVKNGIYELTMTASIEKGWHLYSQKVEQDGPVPTTFSFKSNKGIELIGNVKEPEGHIVDDPVFQMRIKFFEDKAVFKQQFKLTDPSKKSIDFSVEYMACNNTQCLPPETKNYTAALTYKPGSASEFSADAKAKNKLVSDSSSNTAAQEEPVSRLSADTVSESKLVSVKYKPSKHQKEETESSSLLTIFILSFLGGFAALLTPCVFPMIPMTVSFFTKQSKTKADGIKDALLYGCFIIFIYLALGTLVTAVFGADALNALATNVTFNLMFFALLVFFALSFLGAFEIVLPSSWLTKIDEKSQRSGLIGIVFMALALAVVSFSCTGPIVGTLLVQAASQGGLAPVIGMFGFSLAISLPFTIFAAFPGWMNSLPKSGGWLNSVKVFLGFLELALAFKFLSNADLVLQLHLLERETFLAIWIAIFAALSFYLFGKIQLSHDSPLQYLSVGRLSLGIFVMAFTIYLIPGLWGAPLQWISGFPPPQHYSESPNGIGTSKQIGSAPVSLPEGAEQGPQGIPVFLDYEQGLAYAKKVHKPVMLDFTGYACVNCRKMEERVWPANDVLSHLRNDIVLISLYVDDKRMLPENEQFISKINGKKIAYAGQKWSELQILNYKTNAQPYYVLMDHNGESLNEPTAYNPDIQSYARWLKEGIQNFK